MRKIISVFLITFLTTAIFSLEYGLSIDESISAANADLSNSIKTTLWTNVGNESTKFEFRGFYSHSTVTQPEFPYYFDVDILKFSSQFNKSAPELPDLKYTLGRWPIADQTGYIIAHKLDGLYLNFKYPIINFYTNFFYSGLLWKSGSGISPSLLDGVYAGEEDVNLGSPRFIGITGLSLPPLFNQHLSLEFVYQVDLRDDEYLIEEYQDHGVEEIKGGGMLDTFYVSAQFSGAIPISSYFNYELSYIFNSGSSMSSIKEGLDYYEYSEISAHLVEVKLEKFIPSLYNSIISYRFIYSSGDSDYNVYMEGNYKGQAKNFLPITRSGFGAVFSPSLGNIIVHDLSFSLIPIGSLQTVVKALVFTRTTSGPISEDGIDPESDNLFLGTEFDVTANYRPFSDLGVSLTAGFYIPFAGVYNETYLEDNSFQTTIRLNISFSI